jgi:hypothetical protein
MARLERKFVCLYAALRSDDLARAHGRPSTQSLFKRSRTIGTEEDGQGRVAYLSRTTVRWLKVWPEHAGEEGVALIFKRAAPYAAAI